jgi:hypothetical protein
MKSLDEQQKRVMVRMITNKGGMKTRYKENTRIQSEARAKGIRTTETKFSNQMKECIPGTPYCLSATLIV